MLLATTNVLSLKIIAKKAQSLGAKIFLRVKGLKVCLIYAMALLGAQHTMNSILRNMSYGPINLCNF